MHNAIFTMQMQMFPAFLTAFHTSKQPLQLCNHRWHNIFSVKNYSQSCANSLQEQQVCSALCNVLITLGNRELVIGLKYAIAITSTASTYCISFFQFPLIKKVSIFFFLFYRQAFVSGLLHKHQMQYFVVLQSFALIFLLRWFCAIDLMLKAGAK